MIYPKLPKMRVFGLKNDFFGENREMNFTPLDTLGKILVSLSLAKCIYSSFRFTRPVL